LLNYGLRIQCFKASVFKHKEQELFNLEQIIPLKDSEDYIIRMASKNLEELNTQQMVKKLQGARTEF
jgi:succinate dehydrogenase flavin-adding protein (antitoxin of CptAB toxin-antitoxin module)